MVQTRSKEEAHFVCCLSQRLCKEVLQQRNFILAIIHWTFYFPVCALSAMYRRHVIESSSLQGFKEISRLPFTYLFLPRSYFMRCHSHCSSVVTGCPINKTAGCEISIILLNELFTLTRDINKKNCKLKEMQKVRDYMVSK